MGPSSDKDFHRQLTCVFRAFPDFIFLFSAGFSLSLSLVSFSASPLLCKLTSLLAISFSVHFFLCSNIFFHVFFFVFFFIFWICFRADKVALFCSPLFKREWESFDNTSWWSFFRWRFFRWTFFRRTLTTNTLCQRLDMFSYGKSKSEEVITAQSTERTTFRIQPKNFQWQKQHVSVFYYPIICFLSFFLFSKIFFFWVQIQVSKPVLIGSCLQILNTLTSQ